MFLSFVTTEINAICLSRHTFPHQFTPDVSVDETIVLLFIYMWTTHASLLYHNEQKKTHWKWNHFVTITFSIDGILTRVLKMNVVSSSYIYIHHQNVCLYSRTFIKFLYYMEWNVSHTRIIFIPCEIFLFLNMDECHLATWQTQKTIRLNFLLNVGSKQLWWQSFHCYCYFFFVWFFEIFLCCSPNERQNECERVGYAVYSSCHWQC